MRLNLLLSMIVVTLVACGQDDAFTKDSFDKDKYMKIMSEKRDNMLKSNAEVMEKSYAILTPKQKEQFKVLLDLRKEKMNQRIENKIKGDREGEGS